MCRPSRLALCATAVLVLSAALASAQTVSNEANDDPFAAYHEELSGAANRLLAGIAQRPPEAAQPSQSAQQDSPVAPEKLQTAVARVRQLRPLLDPILREEGVPAKLSAVVLVESGGSPTALSPKGARGLWQLMPDTARRYGLTVTADNDERLNLVKATHAAARYLRDLYAQFGDWKLALAAYNAGEQAVQRAIQRVDSKDFRQVSAVLPMETQQYVPAVTAALPLFGATASLAPPTDRTRHPVRVMYAAAEIGD